MKLTKKELEIIWRALYTTAAYDRMKGLTGNVYEKLADKIEKELIK